MTEYNLLNRINEWGEELSWSIETDKLAQAQTALGTYIVEPGPTISLTDCGSHRWQASAFVRHASLPAIALRGKRRIIFDGYRHSSNNPHA